MFPFILRPLGAEPWTTPAENKCDIVSPYGYGGAFAWSVTGEVTEHFWDDFDAWAFEVGVVSSFVRLSLFPDQRLPFRGIEVPNRPNIVRRLPPNPAEVWRDYAPKVRKNVTKARRSGLDVQFDESGKNVDGFYRVYAATMRRRHASRRYDFSRGFFSAVVRDLVGQFVFCHVFHAGQLISTELVLVSAKHMYSFLGGSLPEGLDLRPNDLLKHAVIEWGIERGKTAYVLGGGFHEDDGIYRYKRSFAPGGQLPFNVGQRVFDPDACEQLLSQRRDWEHRRGNEWSPQEKYFPPYRG
jgi:hypothetical protein